MSEPLYQTDAAQDASSFVQNVGVNTHFGWLGSPYTNLQQATLSASYLGLHNLRNVLSANSDSALGQIAALGFRFDLIANTDLNDFIGRAHSLAERYPGSLAALEGRNEVNGSLTFHGLTGYPAESAFQAALYSFAKADSFLSGTSVYNLTISGPDTPSYQAVGDLSQYTDFANVHIYYGGGQPSYGWNLSDPRFFWSNYLAAGQLDAAGRPTVVTETGATTWSGGVSETVQAKQILNSLMDAAKTGVAATYLYELVDSISDPTGANPEAHFGLFHYDWTPKLAAKAVHNFASILTDQSVPLGGGSLTFALTGLPSTGGSHVFQEQGDVYDLVVWAEPDIWDEFRHVEVAAPEQPVTVSFATPYLSIRVYDPLASRDPIQTLSATDTVTLSLTDHPLIIELSGSTATAPEPDPATVDGLMGLPFFFAPGFSLW